MEARVKDAPAAEAPAWPARSTAWYAVGVFTLALMFNQIDANSVALLVTPIKKDLGLSEVQVSLLQGFALAPFYLLVGIPLARFVDTSTRKYMLGGALGFWSLATACCGIAQNFGQLFLARFAIGAGESINGPATYSMLADYFPPQRLPHAIGVIQAGFIAGNALAFLGGGYLLQMALALPEPVVSAPLRIHNWQLLFFFAGLPGLAVAAAMFTLVEPPRRGRTAAPISGTAGERIRQATAEWTETFRLLADKWPVYVPQFVGLGFSAISLFGINQWLFTFFIRTYHWAPQQIGPALGLASFCGSLVGLGIGLLINERFLRQARDDTNMRVLIIAQLMRVPATFATPLMPDPWLAVAMYGIMNVASMIGSPSQAAALQIVTPGRMRGKVSALYIFMFTVIGQGIGPTFVAAITQYVFGADDMLRYSMAIASAILGPATLLVLWTGVRPYAREIARLRKEGAR
jgi:MFS family permease